MTRQRVVLQVLPRLVTGGVERGTVEVAAALTRAGWKAVVASQGGPMAGEIERVGGIHVTLPLASKNPLTMWRNVARLGRVIRDYRIGIVHARSRAPAWSAYFAARNTHVHFVTTFHNAYGASSSFKRAYNSVMAKGERIIAISKFVATYAERTYDVPRIKLCTIPRGVDIGRFDPERINVAGLQQLGRAWHLADDRPIILLPGRLTRWKGQLVFIDAVARRKRHDFIAIIVGSGSSDYREELKRAIWRHGLENTIQIVDECSDMPSAFALADIVVSASTRPEGFGRVIVEAQAMGCLVIATDHGGAEETVIDGKTGWLVPPDDAARLAEAIENALTLPTDERERLCNQALAHVRQNFTTELMTSRTLAVYEEVLGQGQLSSFPSCEED